MRRRVKLIIAYLGTPFLGWQRQASGRTVQGELERAFKVMTRGCEATVVGAGRTDAGVHAAGQAAHMDLAARIPPSSLVKGLNGVLPPEIRVLSARRASLAFHARKSALAKHYTYRVRWSSSAPPWIALRCATLRQLTDRESFDRAVALVPGSRDLASFSVAHPQHGSTRRTIFRAWASHLQGGVNLHFVGDGFLRYQVRRMVGALVQVGWEHLTIDQLKALLDHPRPGTATLTAPAAGLTLQRVFYRPSRLLQPSA